MTLELRGAVVAVTGASAGIGRECVLAFARAGARVAAAARRLDRLEALAAEVRALGGEVLVMKTDVAEADDVHRFVQATVERFGRLDVIVNNAGYGVRGKVEETPVAAYERLMRVNYLGTVHGCQAAIPVMRGQGAGVIVNVSSIVGHRSLPTGGAYAATKAAQISLTEALRVELRGSGVRACSVHPVGTETEFGEVVARESGRTTSTRRLGPQQSARAVAEAIVRARAAAAPGGLSVPDLPRDRVAQRAGAGTVRLAGLSSGATRGTDVAVRRWQPTWPQPLLVNRVDRLSLRRRCVHPPEYDDSSDLPNSASTAKGRQSPPGRVVEEHEPVVDLQPVVDVVGEGRAAGDQAREVGPGDGELHEHSRRPAGQSPRSRERATRATA